MQDVECMMWYGRCGTPLIQGHECKMWYDRCGTPSCKVTNVRRGMADVLAPDAVLKLGLSDLNPTPSDLHKSLPLSMHKGKEISYAFLPMVQMGTYLPFVSEDILDVKVQRGVACL
jgi:hypothetical protein